MWEFFDLSFGLDLNIELDFVVDFGFDLVFGFDLDLGVDLGLGVDLDLVVGDVRHRIDRQPPKRPRANDGEHNSDDHHEVAMVDSEF